MSYSFPLGPEFLDLLPIQSMGFDLPSQAEFSKTAGGEILEAALGTRLWQGKIVLDKMTTDEEADVLAMIDVVTSPGASFMVHDVKRPWLRKDPKGLNLAGSAPTLLDVSADTRSVNIAGLPAGLELSRGDYLAFSYGANPERFALHRVSAPATVGAGGETGLVEVRPNVRPGWAVGATVSMTRAACKAKIVPGSFDPGSRGRLTTGVSFNWIQTLR
ncbi:MAG: hypothetical protein MRY77_14540 [Rhodobacteraceae bacterium]|nr:hypothetical protein [Paracoccaceae bacterium]